CAVTSGGERASVGRRQRNEVATGLDLIAVAHPDDRLGGHTRKQAVIRGGAQMSAAGLTRLARLHVTPQVVADGLQSVADAEHGYTEVEYPRIAVRGALLVNARRSAGEDDAARLQLGDALGGQIMTHHLTEDILFTHPTCDELRVLGAKVEDQDAFRFV